MPLEVFGMGLAVDSSGTGGFRREIDMLCAVKEVFVRICSRCWVHIITEAEVDSGDCVSA